jgi:hypothetical protein
MNTHQKRREILSKLERRIAAMKLLPVSFHDQDEIEIAIRHANQGRERAALRQWTAPGA